MCGVRTGEVSWSASFSGFDAGDLIAARPVTNDFCFQIRQTWGLQRNAPVRTERVNPPAATANPAAAPVNPAGALHAGRERKCSGAKGTPTRRLTVSLPSVCLGAGLPQTPGRGSRPPRALPSQAHNCSNHCAFGCLRLHSARAICGRLPGNSCTSSLAHSRVVHPRHV